MYWGHTTTLGGGDPSTQKHLPFNPLESFMTPADELQEKYEEVYCANGQVPQLLVDTLLETGKITLRMRYRDPLLMLCAFQHKEYTAAWSGTGDSITGDFTDTDHIDYIWIQVHIQDQASTNHLDYFFDGGVITEYKWIVEAGKAIFEEVTIEFTELPVASTTACDIDDGLDDGVFNRAGIDGGFAMWDGTYVAKTCAHSLSSTTTFNAAAISDLNLKKVTLGMKLNKKFEPITSQKTMALVYDQTHEYYMDCEGVLVNESSHAQVLLAPASRTSGTGKVTFGNNTLQCTNMLLKSIEKMVDVAEKLAAQEVVFHYKGGSLPAMSYAWSGNEATGPAAYINGDAV